MFVEILIICLSIITIFFLIEKIVQKKINEIRKEFPWLITSHDELPQLSEEGLKKFISRGFDSELGWVRKPLTSNNETGKKGTTKWSISENGARTNPSFEHLNSKISCYGDSFTFSRQVNDDQTWAQDRKSTRLNSSHSQQSRMPSSA